MNTYDKYIESGIEWLGKIPSHWKIKRGKYVTKLLSGFPFNSDLFSTDEADMPLIRIRDIMNTSTESFYSGSYPSAYIIRKGDVLVGMDGDFNVAIWNGPDGLLNQRVCKVEDVPGYSARYAYYVLPRPLKCINDVTYSTTVKHLSTFDIYREYLPVPPIKEQKSIADFLDAECKKIDDLISKENNRRELLVELRKTIVTSMVTKGLDNSVETIDSHIKSIGAVPKYWKVCQIRHVLVYGKDGIKIGPFGSSLTGKVSADGEYKIYGQWNIIDNDFSAGTAYIEEDTFSDLASYQVISGDVLISMMGTVGKCAIIPDNIQKGIMDSHVVKAKLNPAKMDKDYFALVYDKDNSDVVFAQINEVKKGSIMDGLNSSLIKSLRICVPPIEEQREIVTAVKKQTRSIDSALKKAEKQIKLLKEYKTALITEVVTGKRKVY